MSSFDLADIVCSQKKDKNMCRFTQKDSKLSKENFEPVSKHLGLSFPSLLTSSSSAKIETFFPPY